MSLEVRHYHCRFSLSGFYIMDIFRRARHRRHHSSIGQIDSPSDRMVPTPSPQAGPSRGQSPAEPSHGQSPAGPSRGPSLAGPSCGQSPAGPSCGQSPAGPSHGQSPVGPSCGQSPAGPSHGQSPAGPSCGQSPAGPSHGHSPSPLESPIPARHSTVDIADARLHIVPLGDSFENSVTVVREINQIVNNFWKGDSMSYSSTPAPTKELWWCEFKRLFSWDPYFEMEVKRIFKKKCGDHIRHVLNHAKSTGKKPPFITTDNWVRICNFWQTYECKERSLRNKINQAYNSGDSRAIYAGGSINIEEHSRRLSRDLGKEPDFIDTFVRTFQKKDKTWSGDRARIIKGW
ncbi:uncharacterized protein LOC122048327 [Zingiber officinale]|uniref:uncharacterized protein LOC122048327 n=1 Tax=Zingiber officinale TaxID=94328 RepID=UPI001C4B61F7|nr:uncharacterized protein LOC122048327 [Zingiber officinale]